MQYMKNAGSRECLNILGGPVDLLVFFLKMHLPRYKDKATYLDMQPRQNRTKSVLHIIADVCN